MVLGGVCSGKSSFIKENYKDGYVQIDAGDIFITLSAGEYIDFPSILEGKMNEIGLAQTLKAIKSKQNIVMEFIGDDYDDVSKLIDLLKAIGYEVNIQAISCDEETALDRNAMRPDDSISAFYTQPYHFAWVREALNNR